MAVCLFFAQFLSAQQNKAPQPTLESPYNTMYVHLYYLQPDSYQPDIAAKTVNMPEDSLMAEELAIKLKQVFDGKGLFVHLNLVPKQPDFIDTTTQKPFYTPFPGQLPEVYLEKVDSQWFYSAQTVSAIPQLHKRLYPFGTDFLMDLFPKSARSSFLGLQTWQWVGLVLLLLATWILHFLLSRLLRPLVRLLAKSKYSEPVEDKSLIFKAASLGSIFLMIWALTAALPLLQLPVKTMVWLLSGLQIAGVIMLVLVLLSILDIFMKYAYRYALSTERKLDEQLLPILKGALQVIFVIGGAIYVLGLLDVNVTALIAGLSIGGLALALAAQDTVKNLIGSIMIFFDTPFQIGDWVVFNSIEGSVVEVGFRSTRIRLLDQSIVSVPNDQIASSAVTNMGLRTFRLVKTTLGVTYDIPPVLLEKFIEGMRRMLEENPQVQDETHLVYFHTFGDFSLQIYFRAYVLAATIQEELVIRETLSFGILRLAEALGVRFAFPTSTLFMEEFPGKAPTTPRYETDTDKLDKRLSDFFKEGEQP